MTDARASKRNLTVASVLLIAAAAAIAGGGWLKWMRVTIADGLSQPREVILAGHTWAASLWVVPLVLLAAIAAALALKGVARAVVAVIVAISALVAAYPAMGVVFSDPDTAYIEKVAGLTAAKDYIADAHKLVLGPWLALLGAVLAVAAAVMLVRGLRGGGMGSKYSSPAARRAELEKRVFERAEAENASERDLWDALDSGDDPTEGANKGRPEAEG